MGEEFSAEIMLFSLIFTLLISGLILNYKKKFPKTSEVLGWSTLLVLVLGFVPGLKKVWSSQWQIFYWSKGWIWPKSELGAVVFGLKESLLGYVVFFLGVIYSVIILFQNRNTLQRNFYGRHASSALISLTGVGLAWLGGSIWTVLAGLMLNILAGFLFLSLDSNHSTKFVFERSWGFLLIILGASGLVISRGGLAPFDIAPILIGPLGDSDYYGVLLLLMGLILQFQPFPFLSFLFQSSKTPLTAQLLFTQIFPSWSAFAILMSFPSDIRETTVFKIAGWYALGSGILAIMSGLLQEDWSKSLKAWVSAGALFAFSAITLSSTTAAFIIIIGQSMGALGLSILCNDDPITPPVSVSHFSCQKFLVVLSVLSASGGIGFLSEAGFQSWIFRNDEHLWLIGILFFSTLMYFFLGWNICFRCLKSIKKLGGGFMILPSFLILISLGVLWTGQWISYSDLWEWKLSTLPSLIGLLIPGGTEILEIRPQMKIYYMTYCGVFLLSIISGLWYCQRNFVTRPPLKLEFVRNGFPIHRMGVSIRIVIDAVERVNHLLLEQKVWAVWLPQMSVSFLLGGSTVIQKVGNKMTNKIQRELMKVFEVPAKLLQLLQNGNLQWYLVFGLGMGFAIIIHYLVLWKK